MSRRRRAFTLVEVVLVIGLLGSVTAIIAGLMTINMGYYRRNKQSIDVEQGARTAMAIITAEFRQASHSTQATGSVLIPATDNTVTNELKFTEPAAPGFTAGMASIDVTVQSSFQIAHYYVTGGNTLKRDQSTMDAAGNVLSTTTSTVVSLPSGTIALSVIRIYANAITLQVTATEGSANYTLTCKEVTALAP